MKTRIKSLEKIVEFGKESWRAIKKNKLKIAASLILPFVFAKNLKSGTIQVENGVGGDYYGTMKIKHLEGAKETDDTQDFYYLESPNAIEIYSYNIYDGGKYRIDTRPENSTTTYNLYLKNDGFSGSFDNSLRFKLYNNTNFEWKNIFLGDANDSNNIIADIKHVIYNGDIAPTGTLYGDLYLQKLDGSRTGIYDKRKVFFFNHADLNRDRRVDLDDLAIFSQNWGRDERVEPNDPNNTLGINVGKDVNDLDVYSDINRDYVVDFNDFSEFSKWWLWEAVEPNVL